MEYDLELFDAKNKPYNSTNQFNDDHPIMFTVPKTTPYQKLTENNTVNVCMYANENGTFGMDGSLWIEPSQNDMMYFKCASTHLTKFRVSVDVETLNNQVDL